MIGVIATLKAQPGKGRELETAFAQLAEQVRTNEPGNLAYQLCKSRTEPDTYKVLELYASEEALKAHGQSEHFRAAGAALGSCLVGRPVIEYLDAV